MKLKMETKIPIVSVLMPAYNTEKYVGEAIESILNQSFSSFEYIIIDDHSSDKTWDVISEYAQRDPRIIPIRNECNLGIAGNRNKLLSLAKGKYVVWQDADDVSLPYRLEHQYGFMEKNEDVGICGGWLQFFNHTGDTSIRKYKEKDEDVRKTIFRFSPVSQPSAIIRKKVLDEVGSYDLYYPPAEDLDMSFRIGKNHKFANLQKVVVRYRESYKGATFTQLKTMELKTFSVRLRHSDNKAYKMSFFDHIYNIAQYISMLILPAKIKIKLFNFIRNSKS
jgi:glycosyltransferase involved in cell wall biosynthesis